LVGGKKDLYRITTLRGLFHVVENRTRRAKGGEGGPPKPEEDQVGL